MHKIAVMSIQQLSGCRAKSRLLDFTTKNSFPLFFVAEEALVGIY